MKSSRSRHMLTFGGGGQAKGVCYSATMIEDQSNITFNCQQFCMCVWSAPYNTMLFMHILRKRSHAKTHANAHAISLSTISILIHFDLLASSMYFSDFNHYSISDALLFLKKQLFGCHVISHWRVYIYHQNNCLMESLFLLTIENDSNKCYSNKYAIYAMLSYLIPNIVTIQIYIIHVYIDAPRCIFWNLLLFLIIVMYILVVEC